MTFAAALLVCAAVTTGPQQTPAAHDITGRVTFRGAAVPGAVITATKSDRTITTISDGRGDFRVTPVDAGVWMVRVEHSGFRTLTQTVSVPATGDALTIALTMKAIAEIGRGPTPEPPPASPAVTDPPVEVIDGSSVNGAATPFAQPRAFGNNRPNQRGLYNFGVSALFGNSHWNARPFSFTGADVPVPDYKDAQIGATLAGPLRIPWLVRYGPQTMLSYERGVTHTAVTRSALVPTEAQRAGDLGDLVIPADRISPQAAALLAYYPLPSGPADGGVNLQKPVVTSTTRDAFQLSMAHNVSRRTALSGALSFQRTRAETTTMFEFEDTSRQSTLTAQATVARQVSPRTSFRLRYQVDRETARVTPFFANRTNVSGDAGITGNDQDPANWGPPALVFPDVAGLSSVERQETASLAQTLGGQVFIRRRGHNISGGADVRWQAARIESQPNPRGTLTFTGDATGSAFGDFLLGIPSASAIARGTESIHLRARSYALFLNDDWRPLANLTVNAGVRWEYESPFTETAGRLANLDVGETFSSAAVVTGRSLITPDRRGVQPRIAASWRPSLASSLVVRASYGLYRNLGGYQSLALLLAQQPPFATTFSVQNSASTPLTLAQPFPAAAATSSNTIAIDPNLRAAGAENWQVSVQRELPWSLTAIAAYLGSRGHHLLQAFAPNTEPQGAAEACPACPSGFIYLTSGAASLRNAAQLTLRRRLYAGFTAEAQYVLAKSMDNAATFSPRVGGPAALAIAQDWRNLDAERAPSSFDQRHLFTLQFQYTTGASLVRSAVMDGRWGRLFRDWTFTGRMSAGSGLPVTPIYFRAIPGTGIVGIRPSLTGLPIASGQDGSYADPAAFTAPAPGQWGDAPRNSIRGPRTFSLDAGVARTFQLRPRLALEWRLAITNVLNRVTFSAIDPIVTSPRFGRAIAAQPMRALQMSTRLRF